MSVQRSEEIRGSSYRLRPISVAPMMDRTDRHYRFMLRMLSKHTLLYTEMVTTGAILFGDQKRHLDFSPEEGPISLQLGGDDPVALAECAKIGEDWGYNEININVGCPSDRVQSGRFGACLMLRPKRVAEAVKAMKNTVKIPVTVKHRIGVDDVDQYEDMLRFVDIVSESGCDAFSVHARKAWLSGLSPKENRNIPPLRYEEVYRLKQDRPELQIEINGGIKDWIAIDEHLSHVDAVMIGRGAYSHPRMFMEADRRLFPKEEPARRELAEVISDMADYTDAWVEEGGRAHHVTRHLVHLLAGQVGNKLWRRILSEEAVKQGASGHVIREAWERVSERVKHIEERSLEYQLKSSI